MNAPLHIDATSGIQFREHPTQIDTFVVEVDGIEAGTIEGSGTKFTPRCGRPFPPRRFHEALALIAEVVRHRRECDARQAEIASMSSTEATVAMLERRRDLLQFSASHIDVEARSREIDRQIEFVRGATL